MRKLEEQPGTPTWLRGGQVFELVAEGIGVHGNISRLCRRSFRSQPQLEMPGKRC
jgi:hypothetical protein